MFSIQRCVRWASEILCANNAKSASSLSDFDYGWAFEILCANNAKSASSLSDFDYGSIFKSSSTSANDLKNRSSSPVYDKPVYDEDIFDGLPGVKSKSMSAKVRFNDHVFTSTSSPLYQNQNQSAAFDDLLGNLGRTDKPEPKNSKSSRGFDDLMSGFGDGSPSISSRYFFASVSESGLKHCNFGGPQRCSLFMLLGIIVGFTLLFDD